MLKVENVSKYYGENLAVDNLSFEVNNGEIFGLLGVNGAGKTTTFRMILGLLDKNSGSITLDGKKIDYNISNNIGFLTEERSLLLKLTVKEQAIYYGTLKGMTKSAILEKLDYYLDKFKISEYKERKIKELSKGNQQKIQFICAILNDPKLLILDEPFSGLDPLNVEEFMKIIREFKAKGSSIIFSSHRMEHVEMFCEKLVILVKGKSVLGGELKQIKKDYGKKNIVVDADIKISDVKNIKGVNDVEKNSNEYIIKIENESYIDEVFNYIKKCKNVRKFCVEDASLNEIFVDTVGGCYEE